MTSPPDASRGAGEPVTASMDGAEPGAEVDAAEAGGAAGALEAGEALEVGEALGAGEALGGADPESAASVDVSGADDDLAGRLALAIGRLNRRIRSSTGGLSHGQLSALSTIVRKGPIRPSELAAIEVVAAPTITRIVADLKARGLVEREVDADDRRSFFVLATDAGVELLLRARSDRAQAVVALLAERSSDEVESVRAALPALEAAANIDPGER